MNQKTNTEIQIFIVLLLAAAALALLSMLIGVNVQPPTAAAQGAVPTPAQRFPLSQDTLEAFGLLTGTIQSSSVVTFDLEILKTTQVNTVTSGGLVTFTITITNRGPNQASGVLFYDDFPPQMKNVAYTFSPGAGAISNGAAPTELVWLLSNPIPVSGTVMVTVTGNLTSAGNLTVTNTAVVTPYNPAAEINNGNNTSSVPVGIAGYNPNGFIYLPSVSKFPTPTPLPILYSENFSNSSSGWFKGDTGDCLSEYKDNEYRVVIDKDKTCYRPAPKAAENKFARFEVSARQSGGSDKFKYGIYINGQGGDNFYLFRVDHSGSSCSWRLIRKTETKIQGSCTSQSNGKSSNLLSIKHTSNGVITVSLNGTQLGIYTDSSQLTAVGTGIFAAATEDEATIRFDNFIVYNP